MYFESNLAKKWNNAIKLVKTAKIIKPGAFVLLAFQPKGMDLF